MPGEKVTDELPTFNFLGCELVVSGFDLRAHRGGEELGLELVEVDAQQVLAVDSEQLLHLDAAVGGAEVVEQAGQGIKGGSGLDVGGELAEPWVRPGVDDRAQLVKGFREVGEVAEDHGEGQLVLVRVPQELLEHQQAAYAELKFHGGEPHLAVYPLAGLRTVDSRGIAIRVRERSGDGCIAFQENAHILVEQSLNEMEVTNTYFAVLASEAF